MSAQQKKLNIYELVNGFEDEYLLDACYRALEGIAKAYERSVSKVNGKSHVGKRAKTVQKAIVEKKVSPTIIEQKSRLNGVESSSEKVIPHDLSLVFLANEIFKGSEPLSEAGEIAYERAFNKSLKIEPTLPNRL